MIQHTPSLFEVRCSFLIGLGPVCDKKKREYSWNPFRHFRISMISHAIPSVSGPVLGWAKINDGKILRVPLKDLNSIAFVVHGMRGRNGPRILRRKTLSKAETYCCEGG